MSALTQANSDRVHRWTYTAEANEVSVVLPDGCVDLVVLSCGRTGRGVLHITDWDLAPRLVRLDAGTSLTGYRLRPGTTLDFAEFEIAGRDLSTLETEIEDRTRHDQEISEMIDALCLPGNSVHRLARATGRIGKEPCSVGSVTCRFRPRPSGGSWGGPGERFRLFSVAFRLQRSRCILATVTKPT